LPVPPGQGLLKAVSVDAYIRAFRDPHTGFYYEVPVLELRLENGRRFLMSNVPPEIVEAIQVLNNRKDVPRRQSIYILLMNNESFKDVVVRNIKEVIIDELDMRTGLYTASLVLEEDGFHLTLKMIPSHAVFLALLAGKPIYVREDLAAGAEEEEEEF
jgi:bifunctional DNase/RNase